MATEVTNITTHLTAQSRIASFDENNIEFGKTFTDHMFIADFDGNEWKDLKIVPFSDISIHPANSMMHYGQSIFEGMKAFKNKQGEVFLFRPEMNARRLNKSAERMCMADVPEEIFMEGLKKLIQLDRDWVPTVDGTSLYIRPFLTAWDNFLGIRPSTTYRFMIIACPVGGYYSKPVKVKIETYFSRACEGGTGSAKAAGNYAGSLYPAKQAQENGYDQLIWTDAKEHKYIEEAGTMNVMFIIDDTLVTSPTGSTILNGVTRDSVLTIARDWGLKVEERPIEVAEVITAIKENRLKEAFGAGTAATIAHIDTIGYDGVDYKLPTVEDREFSNKVGKYLLDIKKGRVEDPFGWVMKL